MNTRSVRVDLISNKIQRKGTLHSQKLSIQVCLNIWLMLCLKVKKFIDFFLL